MCAKERCVSPVCQIQKHLHCLVCMALISCRFFYWIAPLSCLKLKIESCFINQLSEQGKKEVAEVFLFMKRF